MTEEINVECVICPQERLSQKAGGMSLQLLTLHMKGLEDMFRSSEMLSSDPYVSNTCS